MAFADEYDSAASKGGAKRHVRDVNPTIRDLGLFLVHDSSAPARTGKGHEAVTILIGHRPCARGLTAAPRRRRTARLARPRRFELLTPRSVVWCSVQLSYGRPPDRRISAAVGDRQGRNDFGRHKTPRPAMRRPDRWRMIFPRRDQGRWLPRSSRPGKWRARKDSNLQPPDS